MDALHYEGCAILFDMTPLTAKNSEAAIFGRLIDLESKNLTPEVAQSILRMSFPESDRARMQELASKSQEGTLTLHEQVELENYNRVGDLLSLWHSKARLVLKKSDASS